MALAALVSHWSSPVVVRRSCSLIVLRQPRACCGPRSSRPLEAPDEPAHVAYAQFMAEAHRIPKRNVCQLGLSPQQIYSPQLNSLMAALHQESQVTGDRPDFQPGR